MNQLIRINMVFLANSDTSPGRWEGFRSEHLDFFYVLCHVNRGAVFWHEKFITALQKIGLLEVIAAIVLCLISCQQVYATQNVEQMMPANRILQSELAKIVSIQYKNKFLESSKFSLDQQEREINKIFNKKTNFSTALTILTDANFSIYPHNKSSTKNYKGQLIAAIKPYKTLGLSVVDATIILDFQGGFVTRAKLDLFLVSP